MSSIRTPNLFIVGVALAVVSIERGAAAQEAPGSGGAGAGSLVTVEQPANLIENPVELPQHPRMRGTPGGSFGLGIYCPLLGTGSVSSGEFCSARLRVGIDFFFGDFHFGGVIGKAMGGGFAGLELGTPYFRLGGRRTPVALAIRASFDVTIARQLTTVPTRLDGGILSFDHSYGPNFSFALSQNVTLDWRLGLGGTLASFFRRGNFADPIHVFMVESTIGVRY